MVPLDSSPRPARPGLDHRAAGPRRRAGAQTRRHPSRLLRERDRPPRFPHRARLRNDVGGHERRVRAGQHHARREVRGRCRGVVDHDVRRPALQLQAQEERPLPRRHPGGRRRRQVQHRPPDGPRHQVGHADLLRVDPQRRGARSPLRADPPQAALRLLAPHARRLPHRTGPSTPRPLPRSSPWRTASRGSRARSWDAARSSSSSG